ncbi:MAG: helix-turn-helix transcriptional regulator [Candidatus Kuenenbacteria bacterium]
MRKNLKKFGHNLKKARIAQGLSLREICKKINYDASNWSKVERGVIAPPSDEKILSKWAKALGLKPNSRARQEFIDEAQISQGIIPQDILAGKNAVDYLPAVFRTLRNEKPTKQEIDRLIELIRNS